MGVDASLTRMADFKPVEANKARILSVRSAPAGTRPEDANAEWVEILVALDGDLANWRVQRLWSHWVAEAQQPVEWEWIYTWGSPAFARSGEIYRIHSGSQVRAALHPLADDLSPGRKHVYVAGPLGEARLRWRKGDYCRLLDAFGTVIDEVVVWPPDPAPAPEEKREAPAAR